MARVRGVSYRAPYGRGVLRLMGEQRVTLRARTLTNILLVPPRFAFVLTLLEDVFCESREKERERDSRGG